MSRELREVAALAVSMTDTPSENRASAGGPGRWARRAAAAAGLLLLTLLGAEATVRFEDWLHWGTPVLSGVTSIDDLARYDATGRHPAPGAAFRKWRINSVGTRGPDPRPAPPAGRVLVLGASESFGLYESPDHEYARQLDDSLRASGCDADVLNAAYPGMSLPTVEQDLRLRLAPLGARAAIYYPTPPQYLDLAPPHPVRTDLSTPPPDALPPWRLRFLGRARDQLKLMLPRVVQDAMRRRVTAKARRAFPADSLFTAVPMDRLDRFDHDLRTLVGTMRHLGITPVLVTHANAFIGTPPAAGDRLRAWEYQYPRTTGSVLVAFDSAANLRIRQIARDSATGLVGAWQAFHGLPADSNFADFSHFTDAGAARMASLLRPAVTTALGCQ